MGILLCPCSGQEQVRISSYFDNIQGTNDASQVNEVKSEMIKLQTQFREAMEGKLRTLTPIHLQKV
jgi:hypothetical protein